MESIEEQLTSYSPNKSSSDTKNWKAGVSHCTWGRKYTPGARGRPGNCAALEYVLSEHRGLNQAHGDEGGMGLGHAQFSSSVASVNPIGSFGKLQLAGELPGRAGALHVHCCLLIFC